MHITGTRTAPYWRTHSSLLPHAQLITATRTAHCCHTHITCTHSRAHALMDITRAPTLTHASHMDACTAHACTHSHTSTRAHTRARASSRSPIFPFSAYLLAYYSLWTKQTPKRGKGVYTFSWERHKWGFTLPYPNWVVFLCSFFMNARTCVKRSQCSNKHGDMITDTHPPHTRAHVSPSPYDIFFLSCFLLPLLLFRTLFSYLVTSFVQQTLVRRLQGLHHEGTDFRSEAPSASRRLTQGYLILYYIFLNYTCVYM